MRLVVYIPEIERAINIQVLNDALYLKVCDLDYVFGKHFLCLETKTKTGRQSDEQRVFQRQVEEHGGLYCLFRSVDEGLRILDDYLKTVKK